MHSHRVSLFLIVAAFFSFTGLLSTLPVASGQSQVEADEPAPAKVRKFGPLKREAPPPKVEKRPDQSGVLGMMLEQQGGTVIVTRVIVDTPAQAAGVREGDRVVTFAGEDVTSLEKLIEFAAAYVTRKEAGDVVEGVLLRGEQRMEVRLELPARPALLAPAEKSEMRVFRDVDLVFCMVVHESSIDGSEGTARFFEMKEVGK